MVCYKILCSECKESFEIPMDEIPKDKNFVIVGMTHQQIDNETRCQGIIIKNTSESEDQFFDPISLAILGFGITLSVGLVQGGATILSGWFSRSRR